MPAKGVLPLIAEEETRIRARADQGSPLSPSSLRRTLNCWKAYEGEVREGVAILIALLRHRERRGT